jgi:hypothetical protein
MKFSVFWNITLCSPLKVNRRFGGACRLHIQGRKIIQARNQHGAGHVLTSLFGPQDGGDILLRKVG